MIRYFYFYINQSLKIMNNFNLEAFVKIDGDKIRVVVSNENYIELRNEVVIINDRLLKSL